MYSSSASIAARRLLHGISVGMAFARGFASQQSTTEVLLQRRWEGSQRPGRLSSTIAFKQLQNKGSAEGFGTKWYQLYCFIVLFCSFPFSKRTHPKASAWDSIPWTASALATSASQKISFQPELQQLDPFWTKESTNPRIDSSINPSPPEFGSRLQWYHVDPEFSLPETFEGMLGCKNSRLLPVTCSRSCCPPQQPTSMDSFAASRAAWLWVRPHGSSCTKRTNIKFKYFVSTNQINFEWQVALAFRRSWNSFPWHTWTPTCLSRFFGELIGLLSMFPGLQSQRAKRAKLETPVFFHLSSVSWVASCIACSRASAHGVWQANGSQTIKFGMHDVRFLSGHSAVPWELREQQNRPAHLLRLPSTHPAICWDSSVWVGGLRWHAHLWRWQKLTYAQPGHKITHPIPCYWLFDRSSHKSYDNLDQRQYLIP